jgi:hypothetical protein
LACQCQWGSSIGTGTTLPVATAATLPVAMAVCHCRLEAAAVEPTSGGWGPGRVPVGWALGPGHEVGPARVGVVGCQCHNLVRSACQFKLLVCWLQLSLPLPVAMCWLRVLLPGADEEVPGPGPGRVPAPSQVGCQLEVASGLSPGPLPLPGTPAVPVGCVALPVALAMPVAGPPLAPAAGYRSSLSCHWQCQRSNVILPWLGFAVIVLTRGTLFLMVAKTRADIPEVRLLPTSKPELSWLVPVPHWQGACQCKL